MRLYLVRHGDAVSSDLDPARPLSAAGREEAARMARFLAEAGVRVARLRHSGKDRARETAEILAPAVLPGGHPEALAGLGPNDPVGPLSEALAGWRDDSLIVGHLPHLARLATGLLVDREVPASLSFAAAATAALERDAAGRWALDWLVAPTLLGPR